MCHPPLRRIRSESQRVWTENGGQAEKKTSDGATLIPLEQDREKELLTQVVSRLGEKFSHEFTGEGPYPRDRFVFYHFALNRLPIWDIASCNMRIRVYRNHGGFVKNRMEFGIDTHNPQLSLEQMDRLLRELDSYARSHRGYERNRRRYDMLYKEEKHSADRFVNETADSIYQLTMDINDIFHRVIL